MKIKNLNQHCENCGVISFCGNPFEYCLCHDERFGDTEENEYCKIAVKAPARELDVCEDCEDDDCDGCEYEDEARNFQCKKIADYVEAALKKLAEKDGE